MSARSERRRERAARVAPAARPARGRRRLPLLPVIAVAAGVGLLGTAWTTTWAPGAGRSEQEQNRFTIEIPEAQQATINSWERFFICYDLLDPAIVDQTLRAAQRARGSLDFPAGGRVEVALPAAEPDTQGAPPASGGGEDEIIAARQAILGAAVPGRMAQVRQQCAAAPA